MPEILLGLILAGPILVGTVATVTGSTGLFLVGLHAAAVPDSRKHMKPRAAAFGKALIFGLAVLAIPAAAFTTLT